MSAVPARKFKTDKRLSGFFPDYKSTPNFDALKQDILRCGVLKAVVVWGDTLVKGEHRLAAIDELREEGHTVADAPVKEMSFACIGEAKEYIIQHADASRPNLHLLDRVKKIEQDKDLAEHLKKTITARRGKTLPEKSREGRRAPTVMEQKAALAGTNEFTYRECLTVCSDPVAEAAVRGNEYSVHAAAGVVTAKKEKVVEKKNAMKQRKKLPDWTNKTAGLNCMVHCDVLKGIPLADNSVDGIFTSPPYPVSQSKVSYIQPFFTGTYYGDGEETYLSKTRKWIKESVRVLKPDRYLVINIDNCGPTKADRERGIFMYNCYSDYCVIGEGEGLKLVDVYCWYKQNAVSNQRVMAGSKEHPRGQRNWEFILVFYKPPVAGTPKREENTDLTKQEWFKLSMAHWDINSRANTRNVKHPCPFPLKLPENVVRLFTRRGEVVLDPFAGSGTTCVAAAKWGRQYIGLEINSNYVKYAEDRIQEEGIAHAIKEAKNAPRRKVKEQSFEELSKARRRWRAKRTGYLIEQSISKAIEAA